MLIAMRPRTLSGLGLRDRYGITDPAAGDDLSDTTNR